MVDLIAELRKNPFVLAPMAAITDSPFRSFMREMGCGVVISELVSSHGIKYGGQRTLDLMRFTEAQRPVGIQIFGEDAAIMAEAAVFVESQGADFVDINLGCPVPKVVKKGAGAGMLRDPLALRDMLTRIKSAIKIPLTIKIRTGWDENSRNASEIVKVAHDAGVTWVAIHGRTRAQGYSGFADWDLIRNVKARSPLPIIGNGDVNSAAKAVQRMKETGVDGIMIGRGCLKNPWIFQQALTLWQKGDHHQDTVTRDFCRALGRLKELVDAKPVGEIREAQGAAVSRESQGVPAPRDHRYALITMKKFTSWFSAGYPHSQQFRRSLFDAPDSETVLATAQNYFSQYDCANQMDTSDEPFLLGGHG